MRVASTGVGESGGAVFGASAGIGGTVSVPIHLDVVVTDASLEIDGQQVLDAGRYVLGEHGA